MVLSIARPTLYHILTKGCSTARQCTVGTTLTGYIYSTTNLVQRHNKTGKILVGQQHNIREKENSSVSAVYAIDNNNIVTATSGKARIGTCFENTKYYYFH